MSKTTPSTRTKTTPTELTNGEPQTFAKGQKSGPYVIGEKYFIRTVTMYHVGILEEVHPIELVLSSASWVADTGRFHDALKSGNFKEIEPFIIDEPVIIGRQAIIDCTRWKHELPTNQK